MTNAELVEKYHNRFKEWVKGSKGRTEIYEDCITYPEDRPGLYNGPDYWTPVLIRIGTYNDVDEIEEEFSDLDDFSPVCDADPTILSNQPIKDYLLAHRIEYVYGTVDRCNIDDVDAEPRLPLSTMRIELPHYVCVRGLLALLVKYGGSLSENGEVEVGGKTLHIFDSE